MALVQHAEHSAAILLARESGETGVHRVVTSSQTRDRNGRLIHQDGWELANYRANPVVLWAHDSDRLPVGRAIDIGIGKHLGQPALISSIQLDVTDPFASKVDSLLDSGTLNAVSAGWIGLQTEAIYDDDHAYVGTDYLRSELLEQSVVPVPANPESLKAALDLDFHREELELVFTELPPDVKPARATIDLGRPSAPKAARPTAEFAAHQAAEQARVRALKRAQ